MLQQALDLAYGGSKYNSVVCLGYHNTGTDGIHTIGYIPTGKVDIEHIKFNKYRDYYITANTLTKKERRAENLFSLKNIVVDIDCHSQEIEGYERQELLEGFLWRMYRDCDIPEPNIIHETGRGLQLWWCLDEVSGSLLFLYKIAVQKLINRLNALRFEYPEFEVLDIDNTASKNPIGYFRLYGSYNTKTGSQSVITIKHAERYDLNELLKAIEVIDEEPETKPVKAQIAVSGEYIALNHKRANFIKWLIESRNAPAGTETRDKILFLFYNASVQFQSREMAKSSTRLLNKQFKQPLDDLNYIFNYIDEKGYLKFKNDTWLDFLSVNDKERSAYTMQETKPNTTRDQKRKMSKDERNAKILEMKKAGKTHTEIAETLEISINTITNFLKTITPKVDRKAKIEEYRAKGLKVDEICRLLGISKQTYYNILKK